MLNILKKEINSFLNSLIAYIVIIVFLTGIGLFMWVIPETNVFDYGFADLDTLFFITPYVFMFLIPAITMRTFAEEKKAGTIELLLTKPLTDWQIIFGKYFSSFLLVIFALLPTLIYYYTVYILGNPVGNIDSAAAAGSYIGLIFLGAIFTSIGIFSSAITKDQIISFIIASALCVIVYSGFSSLAAINVWGKYADLISQLGLAYHYSSMSKGLIDSGDIVYFLGVIAIMLLATKLALETRKW
ncbi:MAG: gliding motility-associated ABC transporter permease subunit GldF [Bacteroidetes bacterium]|nr:gliding motility-associated ABC transporter permease subunit GldF [Bacteroidota bacterium]